MLWLLSLTSWKLRAEILLGRLQDHKNRVI
ncbi:hypothetical protein D3OALGB2SA_108 [Olavius algarvensis associated proteobacterium Delta 3]|nr:hypothetical protein D3OALGB2SA_108 [Olavius algarvensis associated proteobacterium Delta 3]